MNIIDNKPRSEPYSARNSIKPVNFYCDACGAKTVQLVGDFTHWQPLPMQKREGDWWFVQVLLTHGHHHYRFLVDGQPMLDPRAAGVAWDEHNEQVSLLAVS